MITAKFPLGSSSDVRVVGNSQNVEFESSHSESSVDDHPNRRRPDFLQTPSRLSKGDTVESDEAIDRVVI
jgi:hypothetical protein